MSLKLNEHYPGRFDNPSADYPQGSFKNRTSPAAKDGSYLEKDWANDKEGFFQSLIAVAGITPSGIADKVGASQYYDALLSVLYAAARKTPVLPDTGTAGIYKAANTPALTELPSTGYMQRVKIANLNPGASTYSPDGLAARPIYGLGLQPLQGGELPAGVAVLMYLVQAGINGGNGAWIIVESLGGASQIPPATQSQHALQLGQAMTLLSQPGKVDWFATMSPPSGYLAASGTAVSRTTYATLFAAITAQVTGTVTSGSKSISSVDSPQAMWVGMPISGPGIPAGATITAVGASTITLSANATATSTTTVAICPFGVGDGSTTFNVPDGRGCAPRGWDGTAGRDPGRVFGSYQGDTFPVHTHPFGAPAIVQGGSGTTVIQGGTGSGASTGAAGSGSETRMKNLALLACVKF